MKLPPSWFPICTSASVNAALVSGEIGSINFIATDSELRARETECGGRAIWHRQWPGRVSELPKVLEVLRRTDLGLHIELTDLYKGMGSGSALTALRIGKRRAIRNTGAWFGHWLERDVQPRGLRSSVVHGRRSIEALLAHRLQDGFLLTKIAGLSPPCAAAIRC